MTTALIAVTGVALTFTLVWVEVGQGEVPVDWTMFVVMASLLVVCEWSPRFWIRSAEAGVVTPRWMFSFALLLVGSPALALATAVAGTALNSVVRDEPARQTLVRLAATASSMAVAGIMVRSLGIDGTITQYAGVSWHWGSVIVLAGVGILLLNTFILSIDESVKRHMPFTVTLRRGVGTRLTAEGALLSLAPIWVIGIDFSLVLAPLLGTTTVLVFRSTRQALERLHEASHDALTGLLNRRAFRRELTDACGGIGASGSAAVLLMDLDGFKDINDGLGHEFGDQMLVAFADRLRECLPAGAMIARLGGDEFAALLPLPEPETDPEILDRRLAEVHNQLSAAMMLDGFPVSVGVSIGLALAPQDGQSPVDLLRAADIAMYRAKRCDSSVERYDNCLQVPKRGRIGLLSELPAALDNHEITVFFQPQLRLSDGKVDTVEALIRWQHPEHGMVPPVEFIGLAEQTDLIGPITERVLRLAAAGLLMTGDPAVKLAVNVSARSLQDRYFAPHLFSVLAEAGLPPDRLEIEVTERALVSNPERTTYTIASLRDAGVRIAIDDFGSGYSSYQTLRHLEVDRVKVERDFVIGLLDNPRDRAIVQSVISLAHRLGLDVVAEGVETTAVWDALGDLGCDIAQGYVIARPMPFPDLRGWLTRWNELHTSAISA